MQWEEKNIFSQLLVIFGGFSTTALVFSDTLSLWRSGPTITILQSAARPISELPFPAVTLCRAGEEEGAAAVDNTAMLTRVMDLMVGCSKKNKHNLVSSNYRANLLLLILLLPLLAVAGHIVESNPRHIAEKSHWRKNHKMSHWRIIFR